MTAEEARKLNLESILEQVRLRRKEMTQEQIEKRHEELVEMLKAFEQLVVTQQTTFKVHNDRLQALREIYVALTELKALQLEKLEQQEGSEEVRHKSHGQR